MFDQVFYLHETVSVNKLSDFYVTINSSPVFPFKSFSIRMKFKLKVGSLYLLYTDYKLLAFTTKV